MAKFRKMLKPMGFLMGYMSRHRLILTAAVFFVLTGAAASVTAPYLIKPIVNDYLLPGDIPGLVSMLVLLAAVYAVITLSGYCSARLLVRLAQKVTHAIRQDVFNKVQSLPMSYFDKHTHGEIMSLYTNDADTVSTFISNSLSAMITAVLTFVGCVTMMLILNPVLTLVSGAFFAVMAVVVTKSGGISRKSFVAQQRDMAALNGYIEEMTSGQKVIKVFSHEKQAMEGFDERNNALLASSAKAQLFGAIINPFLGGIAATNTSVSSCVGVLMVIAGFMGGRFDIGSLISYIRYMQDAGRPVAQFSGQINFLLAATAGLERLMELLNQPAEVDDGECTISENNGIKVWDSGAPVSGDIRFESVDFGYVQDHQILKNISLHAEPGKKIALVGSTGAGKTTITNLINRFYEINGGSITFDGVDLKDVKKDDLRQSLSMVLQDTHLFTDTVRENIRFGRLDASDEDVENAAKLAGAHFFISHLPQGYDTVLFSDGANLSQGQRQLIAIARAAVADPTILVLDEATSSIDTRTEKLIEEGMDRLMEGRTVFIIAHRLSTVRNCDSILVIEGGEIIERGDHQQLLALGGRYHALYTGAAELD